MKIKIINIMRFLADKLILPVCIVAMAITFALVVSYLFTGGENFFIINAVTVFDLATIAMAIVSVICMVILHFVDNIGDERCYEEEE